LITRLITRIYLEIPALRRNAESHAESQLRGNEVGLL
jgi:hypothetical protein